MQEKYGIMSDEDLIDAIHNGDEQAQNYVLNKYKNIVKLKCRTYFIKGADKEDIVQEGMIGLYKAIRDYQKEKLTSFYSFADLCITRQIITAIKAAARQKHIPMNTYLSLDKTLNDGDDVEKTYLDILEEDGISNPEELLIGQEAKDFIESSMSEVLSLLECRVLSLYLQGRSYLEISYIINKDEKAIDNALQRVRRKVEKIVANKNLTTTTKYAKI